MSSSGRFSRLGSLGSARNYNPSGRNIPSINSCAREINVKRFLDILKKGDILITEQGVGGLLGHAAIMISDNWVLEMEGGEDWQNGIEDNNRRIKKCDWYDLYGSDVITVYRNSDADVAHAAAEWAARTYYNPNGGPEKTKHIKYYLLPAYFSCTDPSYCSKLVLQAYHFGTGDREVIRDMTVLDTFIVPSEIPKYFLSPYTLQVIGTF